MSAVLHEREISRADALIVGAGLGGMSTALRLQQLGLSVLVIDRSDRVGGLCGTVEHNGLARVIACNDFGKGVLEDLRDMGVSHPFERTATRVLHLDRNYTMPPDLRTLGRLSRRLPSLWRYLSGMRAARRSGFRDIASLDQLMDRCGVDRETADLLMLPAYLMGVSPDRFRLDALDHEFQHGYGYTHPVTPVGGPQALADAMAKRIREQGGQILLGCEFQGVDVVGHGKQVRTSLGVIHCDVVVSTHGGHLAPEPSTAEPGLPITMLWLTLDSSYSFPAGVHTHVHYPPGIRHWFGDLYEGRLPDEFGFHIFSSDLAHPPDRFSANVYFYLPRGLEEDLSTQKRARRYVLHHLEALLPGIGAHILESTLISPGTFRQLHGFEARVTPLITRAGVPKPGNYCHLTDTYQAGAAAYPPGDHAGAAIRSARHVKALVAQNHARKHIEAT